MNRSRNRLLTSSLLLLIAILPTAGSADESTLAVAPLTFEERVACVEKIEDVYWAHRIWPEGNPGVKPPRAEVVSRRQVETIVETSLLHEAALRVVWGAALSPAQIQAELDRVALESQHPELLRDVFSALDDDPYLVAECFVRPRLAERTLQHRYAADSEIHAATRRAAETILLSRPTAAGLEAHGASVSDLVFRVADSDAPDMATVGGSAPELLVSPDELADLTRWIEDKLGDLPALVGAGFSPLIEEERRFVSISVLGANDRSLRVSVASWAKDDMESWLEDLSPRPELVNPPRAHFTLPKINTKSFCVDNTWETTSTAGAPGSHSFNATVWTGTEMIVWGGGDWPGINQGGRYDLATNSWTATSTSGAPSARSNLAGVWTGTEMIVWGGVLYPTYYNTGGRYNAATNSWTATSTSGAPSARGYHTAVWTGTEMIVWGGNDNAAYLGTGGRYNPTSNTWAPTSMTGSPTARRQHTAIWSGSEMIVWGGEQGAADFNTGGRYTPTSDSWAPTSLTDVPEARNSHTAVWTGNEMIVWGGDGNISGWTDTGARYDPTTDLWTPTDTSSAPEERIGHSAVWTGSEMIVWGGGPNGSSVIDTGGRYDPVGDVWMATTTTGAPSPRGYHSFVWTGATPKMIIWAGWDATGPTLTGGLYCASGIVPYDFGDAPDPTYPTLLVNDGARHRGGGSLWLGATLDYDDDGQPTVNADGDDLDGTDDEDGVVFTSPANPGGVAGVEVVASEAGLLNAWVDFNADGDWEDAGEQIFADQALATGTNSLVFAVGAGAAVGGTVARFRFDSDGGLLPTGAASDGEVEDHPIEIVELDFGDVPDPTFPTLFASNGARHVIDGVTYLGAAVDADPDGQPSLHANGDDNDAQGDDEDGISYITWPVAGQICTIRVTASAAGVVNAWMDLNADGDWSDPGEQVFTDVAVVAGINNVDYAIPITAATGVETFARFRFSTVGGLSFDGPASDGEVEDYQMGIIALDYGDAPDPTYPTLDASNGARHIIGSGLFLGAGVDLEADGQPSALADGDDLDGSDDEDGVVFASGLGRGLEASLEVTSSGAGLLNAFVDFNADGDWDDAGEQVFTDRVLVAGVNPLTVAVPLGATLGTTFARFRLDTVGSLGPTGYATDGEVEDYRVEIVEGPDLALEMTASVEYVPSGDPLSYTITVTNNGPLPATSVTLTDTLPVAVTFVSSTPGSPECSFAGGTLTCALGALLALESTQVTVETVLDHPVWGSIVNTASVTAAETDPITANNTATVDTRIALFVDGFETGTTAMWSSTAP